MTTSLLRSKFKDQRSNKLAYSAEVASATKAGQIPMFKFWSLMTGNSLIFDVWFLNFVDRRELL